jgi:putative peptidoglycan lipid II flippase
LLRVFGSLVGTGAISWLSYARRLMMVPVGVVAQAAGVASYPFLAELVAKGETRRLQETLNRALRNLLTLLVPLSVWMVIVAEPVVRLIFQQGRFGPADTQQTALLLQVLLTVVFCWGVHQLVSRAFYACQDTVSPALIGTLATVVCLPLFWLLGRSLGAAGVALASALAVALYTAALCWWWARRCGADVFAGLAGAGARVAAVALAAALPAVATVYLEHRLFTGNPYLGAAAAIVVSAGAFGVPFVWLASRFAPALVRPYLERAGRLGRWLGRQGA